MFQDEYDKVEAPAIEQLTQMGWSYVNGAELSPDHKNKERAYFRDVVLVKRLESSLKQLNSWISDENLRKVMREFTHPNFAGLIEYNQALWEMICGTGERAISVSQDVGKGRKDQTVKIIDFDNPDNNDFLCTNQFKVEGVNQNIIPDIVCFVNGLPLAVIECKSPYISSPMAEGIKQLRRYANIRNPQDDEGAPKLFWYNQLMVSTCRDQAKVGTISSSAQHYGEWKDAYPFTDADLAKLGTTDSSEQAQAKVSDVPSAVYLTEAKAVAGEPSVTAQQRLLAGMFNKAAFLDIVQNFTLFEPVEGKLIKKVARYQQFRAVNKVIERLKTGTTRKEKSGVVWHTQGSGKSLTMVMLAVKMRRDPELQKYKLVFITDRTQLDEQLSGTFEKAQSETVYNADSVANLKELLQKDSSDLVTAMVQKFSDLEKADAENAGDNTGDSTGGFANLNPSDKIIVLADEAHRTQFGGLAMTINAALPNAPKIGFTGTPLLKSQKMDSAFGGYIDEYKINEAVEDGATVRILYEGREVITDVSGKSLDKLFDEYFSDKTDDEKREIKKKYGVERAVREAPARIRWVCLDLLKHYREHIQPNGYKAMIVVGSRHAATVFKKTLDELGAPPSEVIISGDHNDEAYIAQYTDTGRANYNRKRKPEQPIARMQKDIIKDFSKPLTEDPTAFIIVKDMLLTGFDAPIAQVMYIDRQLKEHTLMQAIARVNRTRSSPIGKGAKECGFVVDYHGLADYLTEAIEQFSSEDVAGTYYTLKDEIPKLRAAHTRAMAFFKGVKSRDEEDYILLLKDEMIRSQFEIAFKKFAKQMDVILPDAAAQPFISDLKLLGKVHHGARTKYRDPGLDISDAGEKVRALVDEHILSTGVDPKIPPVDLLAANFKESLTANKSAESRASEIESAIKSHLNVNLDEDPEYYRSLSLRLRDIIEKTAGKWEEQVQMLMEFRDTIETNHKKAADDLGLSETELAFYNILMAEVTQAKGDVLGDDVHEQIKSTTQLLVAMFDEATNIVDFFNKPDEVKRMKKEIKRAVLDKPFGDKALVNALQGRFISLAEVKFKA